MARRAARLQSVELVLAPIRYGRRSGKRRGYTYTMVFSKHAPVGQVRVVRCSHAITSADDLITEALHLWEAEELCVIYLVAFAVPTLGPNNPAHEHLEIKL